jgi:hypothetical protein
MPAYITKDIFLKTFTCPTLGWETIHSNLNRRYKILMFPDRFDILLKMRLSGVAEQNYTMLYGNIQTKEQYYGKE